MDGLMQNVPLTVDRISTMRRPGTARAKSCRATPKDASADRAMPQSTPMRSGYRTRWWPPGSSRATAMIYDDEIGMARGTSPPGMARRGSGRCFTRSIRGCSWSRSPISPIVPPTVADRRSGGGRSGRRIAGAGAVDQQVIFFCRRAALPQTHYPAWRSTTGSRGIPPNMTGAGSTKTAPAAIATSGTTGNPKGVLYSHRSNYIHMLMTLQRAGLVGARHRAACVADVSCQCVGRHSAPAVGAKLVLPGQRMDGESIYNLIEEEGVTYSAAVPTVWRSLLLQYMQENGKALRRWNASRSRGSACPDR